MASLVATPVLEQASCGRTGTGRTRHRDTSDQTQQAASPRARWRWRAPLDEGLSKTVRGWWRHEVARFPFSPLMLLFLAVCRAGQQTVLVRLASGPDDRVLAGAGIVDTNAARPRRRQRVSMPLDSWSPD